MSIQAFGLKVSVGELFRSTHICLDDDKRLFEIWRFINQHMKNGGQGFSMRFFFNIKNAHFICPSDILGFELVGADRDKQMSSLDGHLPY